MFDSLKILYHQGKQFIPNVETAEVPGIYRGRPIISLDKVDEQAFAKCCPTGAIGTNPISIDLGKCLYCGECAKLFPHKVRFTKDYKMAVNHRDDLVIVEGVDEPIRLRKELIRPEIRPLFKRSLKLRQVSAGGDNSNEWELNASNNVQFYISRFGIEFVASPRHADGIVVTGPISRNMAQALRIAYDATPEPKILVLVGCDAISGGLYADSPEVDRSSLNEVKVDLYIPGNPVHPLEFINGLIDLTGVSQREKE